jgi:phosphoribosylglycinamide formyltransferase-1
MRPEQLRIAALISGGGRTALNLHQRSLEGTLSARIERVISSRGSAAGVERARAAGLETVVIERRQLSPADFQRALTDAVGDVDLVCLAGFLSLWVIPPGFTGRVMNIHPALLPDFGGRGMFGHHVHEAVLAAGRSDSGCTVHFCDNQYDHGPIILQRRVPVLPADSPDDLAARVFTEECEAYPEAVQLFAENRLRIVGEKVEILPADS